MTKARPIVNDSEFPVSLATFAQTLRLSSDEVWVGVLKSQYVYKKLTISGWKALIEQLKSQPILPGR